MASPKVFVSSTCFDLGEIRDSIRGFIRSFGFDPVLSEYGDVFYHPDLHTHEACVHEISNCQLFILIIGGRFGGRYIYEKEKSITNAEYEAAVNNKIPIFTYIKKCVLENHQLYQDNKEKPFVKDIMFPAIEKQQDSISIFEFINKVRKASVNNGYEAFEFAKEIEEHLRKQWAGMFFDYLKTREARDEINNTNYLLSSLKVTSDKLESIVKNIYLNVDKENSASNIDKIEVESKARMFISRTISDTSSGGIHVASEKDKEMVFDVDPKQCKWHEYLVKIGLLEIIEENDKEIELWLPENIRDIHTNEEGYVGVTVKKKKLIKYQQETKDAYENGFCNLTHEERKALLDPYIFVSPDYFA